MDRKHCGKSRNCSLQAISPFPTMFSKDLHVKTRACLGKGYDLELHGKELTRHIFKEFAENNCIFLTNDGRPTSICL